MTVALAALALTLLAMGAAWWWERRAHRRVLAELQRECATVEAARVLYGEARMREAARLVAMREKGEE